MHREQAEPTPVGAVGSIYARAWLAVEQVRWAGLDRWQRLPRWGQALAVFVACQLVTAVMLERAARFTALNAEQTGDWPYLRFVARWDSAWYRKIAQFGYPDVIPRDEHGVAQENPWAFYPLFPLLSRAMARLPGIGWPLGGWLVAVVAAVASALVLRSLVDRLLGPSVALWSVALLAAFPTAPALQFPYTESVGLLLLLAALWCLQRCRYALAVPVVLLIGITRPIAIPLAGVIAVHLLIRLRRRDRRPLPRSDQVWLVVLLGAVLLAAVEWPLIAWFVTGDASAYPDSMAAWRFPHRVTPVLPWLTAADHYLGEPFGRVALAAAAVALIWWLTRRIAVRLGHDLRVWCICYLGYLLVVLDPTTSLARYLLLLFPLGALLAAASPSVLYRRALLVGSFICQLIWIVTIWRVGANPP